MSSMSNSGSGSDNLLLFISDKMHLKHCNKFRSPISHLKFLLISLHCMCTIRVMFHTNNMKLFTTDFPCSVSSPGHVPANCQGNGVLGWSESCTQRPCCKKLHVRLFHPGIICFMHGVSLVFSGHSQDLSHSCVVMKKIWESEAACCTSYSGLKTISRVQSKHSVLSLSQTRWSQTRWSQTRWSQTRWSQASCSKCNV